MTIKYVHTNLVAKNWQGLAAFYVRVLGCKVKPPERNLKGEWLDLLTALKNVHIRGIHFGAVALRFVCFHIMGTSKNLLLLYLSFLAGR